MTGNAHSLETLDKEGLGKGLGEPSGPVEKRCFARVLVEWRQLASEVLRETRQNAPQFVGPGRTDLAERSDG